MPRILGRATVAAALTAPLVLFVAPFTASADVPDGSFAGGVATPNGAAIAYVPFDHETVLMTTPTVVQEIDPVDEELVDEDIVDEDIADEDVVWDEDETEDVLVADDETVDLLPVATPMSVTDDDDDDVHHHVYSDATWDDDVTAAHYEDTVVSAGAGGAWVTTVESGAYSADDHDILSGSDTGAWYEETTAAAGSGGAFVESTSSAAVSDSDDGWTDDWSHDDWSHDGWSDGWSDDDDTYAEYEHTGASAGPGGAWVGDLDSGAYESD